MTSEHDPPSRVSAALVAGGRFHDIDFARLELLKLMVEHPHVRVSVHSDYEATDAIVGADLLVSYTCDVRPSTDAQDAIASWVEAGGRWIALHGTNAALDLGVAGVSTPRCFPTWAETLGSQFIAHPPIAPYTVAAVSDHWLVDGIEPFETDDELYLCDYHDRGSFDVHLATNWTGTAAGFDESDWTNGDGQRLVQYVRPLGDGAVLYNTLGHCRSHWDMAPMTDYYPRIERCSWEAPQYYELLRRALRWGLRMDA